MRRSVRTGWPHPSQSDSRLRPVGLLDLADRKSGHAVIVTLWATKEARDASADFARNAMKSVADEGDEQVISMRDYEVGHYMSATAFRQTR